MTVLFPGDHDQEVVYLRELLKGFGHPQKKPTEIWKDYVSCIMMSENLTNRDRTCQMCRYSECFGRFCRVSLQTTVTYPSSTARELQ
jgi:hypothetical protein